MARREAVRPLLLTDAPLLEPGEPSPVEFWRENGRSSFVIICDHACRERFYAKLESATIEAMLSM